MANELPAALVTGAAGFLGAHLVRALQQEGAVRVVALDDLSGGERGNVPDGVEFVEASIVDHDTLRRLFDQHHFRFVYHLAAYAAEGLSHFIRRFNYTNNIIGSINLINEAVRHECECFVFTSSIAVYGALPPPMRESDRPAPEDPYGVAKFAVELDLEAARHQFGLPYVIFRPHNVYGEYQNLGDPYRNVIGIFMKQILRGEPLTIFGDGSQQRAFSYVGDIAPLMARSSWVPEARNQVFNVGADTPCSVGDLARMVCKAMGKPDHPIEHLPPRKEVLHAYSNHDKAKRVFGASAETPLAEGLRRMAAWAQATGVRESQPFEGVEVRRNMPPSWLRLLRDR